MSGTLLFGAGASYGSKNIGVPPLGDKLFIDLQQFDPRGWGSLPSSLSNEFRGDFENGMKKLANSYSHKMPVLQRAMAAFFFRYLPTQDNMYHILAKRIKHSGWSGSMTTLNYERLLELSLLAEDMQPIVGNHPNSEGSVELCLPHGCCHLFCEGFSADAVGISFSGIGINFVAPVKQITDAAEFSRHIRNDAVPPVMSYFEPEKRTSAGVQFIDSQRKRWSQLARESKVIAIVGIKVREQDVHIWEPLKTASGKIVYCGGKQSGSEFDTWHNKYRNGISHITLPGYFSDEIDAICNELGMNF